MVEQQDYQFKKVNLIIPDSETVELNDKAREFLPITLKLINVDNLNRNEIFTLLSEFTKIPQLEGAAYSYLFIDPCFNNAIKIINNMSIKPLSEAADMNHLKNLRKSFRDIFFSNRDNLNQLSDHLSLNIENAQILLQCLGICTLEFYAEFDQTNKRYCDQILETIYNSFRINAPDYIYYLRYAVEVYQGKTPEPLPKEINERFIRNNMQLDRIVSILNTIANITSETTTLTSLMRYKDVVEISIPSLPDNVIEEIFIVFEKKLKQFHIDIYKEAFDESQIKARVDFWKDSRQALTLFSKRSVPLNEVKEFDLLINSAREVRDQYLKIQINSTNEFVPLPKDEVERKSRLKVLKESLAKGKGSKIPSIWNHQNLSELIACTYDQNVIFFDLNGVVISEHISGNYSKDDINPDFQGLFNALKEKYGENTVFIAWTNAGEGESHQVFINSMLEIGIYDVFDIIITGQNDDRVIMKNGKQQTTIDYRAAVANCTEPFRDRKHYQFEEAKSVKFIPALVPFARIKAIIDNSYFQIQKLARIGKWQIVVDSWMNSAKGYLGNSNPKLTDHEMIIELIDNINLNK